MLQKLFQDDTLQYLWQEWQIGYRLVVFQAVGIKTSLFQQMLDKSMFKTMWYNTRWQRLTHDTGHYGNNFVQTIIKDRGGYGVKVTRLFGHFLDYSMSNSTKLTENYKRWLSQGCFFVLIIDYCKVFNQKVNQHWLIGLVVKVSASWVAGPGLIPAFHMDILLGWVIPVTLKLVLQWLPCQASGEIASAHGAVGLVSVYCDWVR